LLTTILLLAGSRYAHAQNTGSEPYLDSEHSYRVNIGDVANERAWFITNGTDITYTLLDTKNGDNSPVAPADSWASVIPTGSGAGQAGTGFHGVKIFFDSDDFSTGGWVLQYFEYQEHDGGTYECISARSFDLTLAENTFWLLVNTDETDDVTGGGIDVYNSQNTLVHSITDLEDPGDLFNTTVTYTVTMNKGADFAPTYWQFNTNFADEVQSFNAVVSTTNGGAATTTPVTAGQEYTVEVTPETGYNIDLVEVTITVEYNHNVLSDITRNLMVTNGIAVFENPPAPDAITDDNITTYPSGDEGNRTQAITILAIPSTQDITFDNSTNTNETATSAQNPLQNSTHYYKVEMGAVANTGAWHLEDSDDAPVSTGVTINGTENTTDALATIDYGELAIGNYTLYYTETDGTTGASTVRAYPISILPPFDVDIAAVDNDCNGLSGNISQASVNGDTEVDYTVTLETSGYENSWEFDFLVSCADLGSTLSISSIVVSGADQATISNGGAVTVTKGATPVNTTVTITVTYSGVYAANHIVTATLPDGSISGSFGETDVDDGATIDGGGTEGDINQARHTIYRLPQPGELAGMN
jgi:hypothetical protein